MTSTRSKSGFTITFSFKCGNKVTVVHKDAMGKEMWDILHYKPDDTRFMAAYYALKHGVIYYLPPTGEVTIDPQHKLRLLAFTRWLAAMPETYPLNPKNVELAGLDHLSKMFEVAFPDHTVDSVVEEDGKLMVIVINLLEDCIEKLAVN